jgi:hypothetical protein
MELSKAVRELAPDSRDSHLEQLEVSSTPLTLTKVTQHVQIRVKELEALPN